VEKLFKEACRAAHKVQMETFFLPRSMEARVILEVEVNFTLMLPDTS
jgi:hypothetical protein